MPAGYILPREDEVVCLVPAVFVVLSTRYDPFAPPAGTNYEVAESAAAKFLRNVMNQRQLAGFVLALFSFAVAAEQVLGTSPTTRASVQEFIDASLELEKQGDLRRALARLLPFSAGDP